MKEYGFILFVLAVFIIFAIQAYRSKKEAIRQLEEKINNNYGNKLKRKYDNGEIEKISHFHEYVKEKYQSREVIDDITWNDLNMDEIFKDLNNTYSSVGEEYLYDMLRTLKNTEDLKEFDSIVSYLYEHENEAKNIQKKCNGIGYSRKVSLYEYIHRLTDLEKKSNLKHYIQIVAMIAATASLFIIPEIGIACFIAVLSYNIITYYNQKRDIELYFSCFKHLINLLSVSKRLEKELSDEFDFYKKELVLACKNLKSLENGVFVISTGLDGSISEVIMDYARMIFHLDIIKFNSMLQVAIDKMEYIDKLFLAVGRLEAAAAIASYRKYLTTKYEEYCTPDIIEDDKLKIEFEDIYHPLIDEPVKNSLKENRGVLLTGSNASGKSTFLKTVAINAIFARTIYTCTAKKYVTSPFVIYSSMALRDDLNNHESYYIVEIKALKRIIDATGSSPMMCFVDEVLRGTNTVERIAASSEILKSLSGSNTLCFAATHDIELTHILENQYSNYHFEESIIENDIFFNYLLKKGRATTRNAIKLLKVMGYDDKIIEDAQLLADKFIETGTW